MKTEVTVWEWQFKLRYLCRDKQKFTSLLGNEPATSSPFRGIMNPLNQLQQEVHVDSHNLQRLSRGNFPLGLETDHVSKTTRTFCKTYPVFPICNLLSPPPHLQNLPAHCHRMGCRSSIRNSHRGWTLLRDTWRKSCPLLYQLEWNVNVWVDK